jgi:alkylation response protein AidB-like acyl-CoA dehydrogenase
MDFAHTQNRQMLADTLRRFLGDRYDFATRQQIAGSRDGFSRAMWVELAELGIVGALFSEAAGGYSGDGFDVAVIFEALGRVLAVEPFLGAAMAAPFISDQPELVTAVISGTPIVTTALYEPQGRYDPAEIQTQAKRSGKGWSLSGSKAVVPQIEAANFVVVSARTSGEPGDEDGISLFLVPAAGGGVSIHGYPLIDGGRGGELVLSEVVLGAGALLGQEGAGLGAIEHAVAAGIVALCAEAVGIMDWIRDATVDYLQTRTQFGTPIGKFQAIRHRMATVLLEIEQARSAMINAAAALSAKRLIRERAVSAAKFTIGRVGTLVAEEAIQMHGGIGMTWDLPLAHYAKRLVMIGHQLGDEDHHLERFVALADAGMEHALTLTGARVDDIGR